LTALLLATATLGVALPAQAQMPLAKPERTPDVPYQPTNDEVVVGMLNLAKVTNKDIVYDLGCGDGRIVIAAVKERGARGVCVEIDPKLVAQARANAKKAGVEDRIKFLTQDLFKTDFHDATVVMLFLWPEVNLKLRPTLQRELAPGSRVVSHMHNMGDWPPEQRVDIKATDRERVIYLWTIAKQAGK
jgi:SAM-dependent methyltransferase